VAAAVRLKPGETAAAEEIEEYCEGRIARFKIPRYIRFVDSFPMTASGKVQKFKLREMHIAQNSEARSQKPESG
jgi:fatty-acyl-CoA synthase